MEYYCPEQFFPNNNHNTLRRTNSNQAEELYPFLLPFKLFLYQCKYIQWVICELPPYFHFLLIPHCSLLGHI